MTTDTDVAIIGAGPYGLSLAAHLAETSVAYRIFGEPMQFWRDHMPEGMVLKSEGFASTLWHPRGALTLKDYCAEQGVAYKDSGLPVPLQTFRDYGTAFQARYVHGLDPRRVVRLEPDPRDFSLRLDDGATVTSRRVVLATGIGSFAFTPEELTPLGDLCTHSTNHRVLDGFAGKQVLIVGGGASGVELAGLLSERGCRVTLAVRDDRIRFCGPPRPRSLLDRLKAPESGLGTGWRSLACVMAPMVFYHMPEGFRLMVVRRHLGPAPGWTSRAAVERDVSVLRGAQLLRSWAAEGRARVSFVMSDTTLRTVEADHVIAATGFRPDVQRLSFLGPQLARGLRLAGSTPVLSPQFETSVPGLFTVGVLAANSFGPLLRFVYGAGFASRRLTRHLAKGAVRRPLAGRAGTPRLTPA